MRKLIARLAAASVMALVMVGVAIAGAPLKGVDVKLGKNPGGGLASRVTDAGGNFDFGVLPKGNYSITLVFPKGKKGSVAEPAATKLVVNGPAGGAISRIMKGATSDGAAVARVAADGQAAAVDFAADGVHRIAGSVSAGE